MVDWATRGSAPKERLLTLYRLSDAVADKLKSLFTLFAGSLVAKAADLLDVNNTSKTGTKFCLSDKPDERHLTIEQIFTFA